MRSHTVLRIALLVAVAAALLIAPAAPAKSQRIPGVRGYQQQVSGADVIAYAKQFIGARYRHGASGPRSFDCSGFTAFVYAHFGFNFTHSSYDQAKIGWRVRRADLQLGDIVVYNRGGHVGLYAGRGRFINATSSRGVRIVRMKSWPQRYTTGRRILAHPEGPTNPLAGSPTNGGVGG